MRQIKRKIRAFSIVSLFLLYYFSTPLSSTEQIEIVELPTAGVLSKGSYSIQSNFFGMGGMRLGLLVAPFNNFMLGVSFSGTNIIGNGEVSFQKLPAARLSYRFLDEKITFPALALGISTQGFGFYDSRLQRFQTLSPGLYLVASKGFKNFLGVVDFHFGLNYSLEPKPAERSLNFYTGLAQSILRYLQLNLEFNANLDEKTTEVMSRKGLLNFSLLFFVNPNVKIGLILKDLFGNFQGRNAAERNIVLHYYGKF